MGTGHPLTLFPAAFFPAPSPKSLGCSPCCQPAGSQTGISPTELGAGEQRARLRCSLTDPISPAPKSQFPPAFQRISADIFSHYSFRLSKLFRHQGSRCCHLPEGRGSGLGSRRGVCSCWSARGRAGGSGKAAPGEGAHGPSSPALLAGRLESGFVPPALTKRLALQWFARKGSPKKFSECWKLLLHGVRGDPPSGFPVPLPFLFVCFAFYFPSFLVLPKLAGKIKVGNE